MSDLAPPPYCDSPEAVPREVAAFVRHERLLRGVRRLGLAVSGGADSVALFHLLLPLCRSAGVRPFVLHLNHGLRAEAAAEADFVRALAEAAGVPFRSAQADLASCPHAGESLEMAARAARQAFFASCCRADRLDAIATGHHADDVAETLLLRLFRGAGAAGLSGLRASAPAAPEWAHAAGRPYRLIRPLLTHSRAALRAWLEQSARTWLEDGSNRCCEIPRNRLRHLLLPRLEQEAGAPLRANLCRTADLLRADDALLDTLAERRLRTVAPGLRLDLRRLNRQPEALRRRLLRLWLFRQGLAEAGFERVRQLSELCRSSAPGGRLQLAPGRFAAREGDVLELVRAARAAPAPQDVLPACGTLVWDGLEIASEPGAGIRSEANGVGTYPAACSLDAAALEGRPVRVRARRPGDRIAPTGLRGSKKLQDLFVDAKIPSARRAHIPVFTVGDDVAWIPGYRVARAYAVRTPEAPCLHLTVRAAPL